MMEEANENANGGERQVGGRKFLSRIEGVVVDA
jgi:hypothetical protein